MRLSVVIPVYNEERTIGEVIARLKSLDLDAEIVVVDDGSTDRTHIIALGAGAIVIGHERNQGKGAALQTGFAHSTGDVIVVQDGDLEYFPEDLPSMFDALTAENRPIVFGSRNLGFWSGLHKGRGAAPFYWGGRLVGWMCNLLFGTALTDAPTCYKMFRRGVLDRFELKAQGFGFCPEFIARAARARFPIHEVPIRYAPRGRAEGKKLRSRDGLTALAILVAIRLGIW